MTYNITNSINGYFASLNQGDGSVAAITNQLTGETISPSEYFNNNQNQDLINEIYQNQNLDSPFAVNIQTSDLNISTPEETNQLLNDTQQSNSNTETDNNVNGNQSPAAGQPPSITPPGIDGTNAGDYNEATQNRNFGALVYPIDAQYSQGQDNLYIEQFSYQPPTSALFSQSFSSTLSGVQSVAPIEVLLGSVRLPIPDGISDQNSVSWNDSAIGPGQAAAVAGAMGIANAVGNVAQTAMDEGAGAAVQKGLELTGGGIKELGNVLKNPVFGDILRRQLISSATNAIGFGVSPEELLTRSSGRITNKNLELLFSGQSLRQFSFAFQFAPRNNNEAQAVRKIIRFFKQGSAPKKSALGDQGAAFFLKTPNVFRISYRKGLEDHIKGLNKFKICACQGVGINYAPNGYASYQDDSQPVSVSMSLSFTELTPLFYDDYETPDDFLSVPNQMDVDDVGF